MSALRRAVHRLLDLPPERGPVAVSGDAPPLPRDRPLRVVSWNVQFGAGRSRLFFYDGGDAVSVPGPEAAATTRRIGRQLRDLDPDVVLLQEVDRRSDRTGRLDELALLREECGLPVWASTPYYRVRYVPHPRHQPLGRVDVHLALLSRFRVVDAWRHPLALLAEPAARRLFNLRRAVLAADLPVEGGGLVTLMNTHLSAFSRGDGTLARQVRQVGDLCAGARGPWLLAGDFNALPPGVPADGLPDAVLYPERTSPIEPLFERLAPTLSLDDYRREPSRWFTYQRSGRAPDRVLDYAFTGRMREVDLEVVQTELSDHLPLVITATPEPGDPAGAPIRY